MTPKVQDLMKEVKILLCTWGVHGNKVLIHNAVFVIKAVLIHAPVPFLLLTSHSH